MAKKPTKKKTTRKKSTKKAATKKKSSSKKTAKKAAKKTAKKAAKKSSAKKAAPKAAPKAAAPVVKKVKKATKPKNSRTLAYTQSEFIENVRSYCGLDKRNEARDLCEDIADFITDSLKKGYRIPLMGLGKLYVRKSKARMGRNPATGEPISIPAKKRVRFTVAKALKDSVL
ncbi:MAG: HU family DNA-binding protein [Bdellovibrionota bacterium]